MIHVEKGNQEGNKVEVRVTVEQAQVQQEFNNMYRELSQKVKIPGFRSGRIPDNILELNLGKEYIHHQVAEKLIKDSYSEALDQSQLDPIDVPKVDLVQIDREKPFIYKMALEVKPEISIPELDDLSIEKKNPEVKESQVDEDLENIRESHGKLKAVEDRESKIGDFLVIDYESFVDDKPLPDGKKEKQLIQLGDSMPPEFNEGLVCLKPGDQKEITLKVPDNFQEKKMAGKEVVYRIQLSDIKEKELPLLDDEFAKSLGSYQNLEELKQHVRKQLQERAKYQADMEFSDTLMEKVAEKCHFEVPEVLVDKQLENMMNNLKEDLKRRNISLEDYYRMIKADEEKVKKEYRTIAENQIKKELIIDRIIQDDKITATDQEVEQKIAEIAESTNQKPLKVRAMFEKNKTLDNLREQIKRDKVIENLSRKIKIIEK